MISWICLPPELEKSVTVSSLCSSLGNGSFSLFYIIVVIILIYFINLLLFSLSYGGGSVEMEHGLFSPTGHTVRVPVCFPDSGSSPVLQPPYAPHRASHCHPASKWEGGAFGNGCGKRAQAFIFLAAYCMMTIF